MSINYSLLHNSADLMTNSSDLSSDEYLKMNRCGWSECDISIHHTIRPNGRADYNLMYIKSQEIKIDDTIVPAGNMYLYRPGEPQDYSLEKEGAKIYWIHFSGYLADKLFKDTEYSVFPAIYQDEVENFCLNTIKKYYTSNLDEFIEMEATGELLSILSKIAFSLKSPHSSLDRRVENIVTYIHEHPTENLSNEEYAKMCELSKGHFIHLFTTETGLSPQKYRINLLLDKSIALLEDSELKVYEIADALGIDDSLYFCRIFKKRFKISPTQYRRKSRDI